MPRILLVDDDRDLAHLVQEWLTSQSYTLDLAYDGTSGYEFVKSGQFDVIILDWDLPYLSGVEICKLYRAGGGKTPILILTGKRHIADKETDLDAGADDYLTKPFSMRELAARLRALQRRQPDLKETALKRGDIELILSEHRVLKRGVEVHLLPKDFEIFAVLMQHPTEVFSADALLVKVWGLAAEATTDAVRTSIKRIRQQLDDEGAGDNSVIQNIRGVGYRLRP